ncbi:hypothetical protein [Bacillus sp. UNC41MFS5]|nr:hypothetical protein [Bacillus sp. UNC41MFS5]
MALNGPITMVCKALAYIPLVPVPFAACRHTKRVEKRNSKV